MEIEELIEEQEDNVEEIEEGQEGEAQTEGDDEEPELTQDEQRAYEKGWRPKEEWVEARGTEDGWYPADEFLEFGDPRAMRKKMEAMQRQIDSGERSRKRDFEKQQRAFEQGLEMQKSAIEREYDQKIREAVDDGDGDQFEKLNKEKAEAVGKLEEAPKTETSETDPDAAEWLERNDWMEIDEPARNLANLVFARHQKANPDATISDSLEAAEKRVRKKFPHYFDDEEDEPAPKTQRNGKERTMADVKVASGNRKGTTRQKAPAASLTPTEIQVADTLIRRGLFKDHDEYAKALVAENTKREARMQG